MKCVIDEKEVNAKLIENLGYQGGAYRKAVEYKGKEYILTKINSIWKQDDMINKII